MVSCATVLHEENQRDCHSMENCEDLDETEQETGFDEYLWQETSDFEFDSGRCGSCDQEHDETFSNYTEYDGHHD